MNRNKDSKKRRRRLQVWTFAQAREAAPYLSSVMHSVRDRRLEALGHDLRALRLAAAPGRPDRAALIAHEEAVGDARRADAGYREALKELAAIGVYCLDPVAGFAVVPFIKDDQLAWFLFDLFDAEPFRFWRFHNDQADERRPIAEAEAGPDTMVA